MRPTPTVYLSAWARVDGMTLADMDRALYVDRSLVHLAMRRTLFLFPRGTLSVHRRGEQPRGRRRATEAHSRSREAGLHRNGERWLTEARGQVLAALSDGREATSSELRDEIPSLEGSIDLEEGKWGGPFPIGPRVLTTMSAAGLVVRASNAGAWTTSRPRWASMESWLGEEIEPGPEADGVAELVERWLRVFGPGTAADIKWWLGSTVAAVRRALADLSAVEVDLGGQTGYLLPDDLEPTEPIEPWPALLPPLDPTTMGWFERDWYLGKYKTLLFDTTGNAGPTVVGRPDRRRLASGRHREVELRMLEDVGSDGCARSSRRRSA